MSVIVTDAGFAPDDWTAPLTPLAEATSASVGLEVPSDTSPEALRAALALAPDIRLLTVGFPSAADGRGFTLARLARLAGYSGRLRAAGHVIADQYAMARRSGFDEVAIDEALAARQPEPQWLARADWQAHDYQSRLRG